MPPLFTSNDKIKLIEYGQHARGDVSMASVKEFFSKILNFKAAK